MPKIWLSIGSNQQRQQNVQASIDALSAQFGQLIISPVYKTVSEGFDGDDFYNLVIGIHSDMSPTDLQQRLRAIEDQQGRKRSEQKFNPRTLDIDLLTYGNEVIKTANLDIPRGEITKYAFVLGPLADIAPTEQHPETGESYLSMWQAFQARQQVNLKTVDMAKFNLPTNALLS